MQARLLLEDGTLFTGRAFGSEGSQTGEIVFHTGIAGYQEVISDPSHCGHIVTMTYPLIGNTGIAKNDFESIRPHIHGLIVREYETIPSNWRAEYTLDRLLKEYGIVGISGIDTRFLTRIIRQNGVMKGLLTTSNQSIEELKEQLNVSELLRDQTSRVSTKHTYFSPGNKERIVIIDFGLKNSIMSELVERGCDVVVVPYDTTAEQIRRLAPDGILLSGGPGNPKDLPQAVAAIQELLGQYPIFGIDIGHQLLALACGADTEKLKFHRGGNQPVKDLLADHCFFSPHNHSYIVSKDSVEGTELTITHINNNDGTVAGLKHSKLPAFSIQAAPGAFDSNYLYDNFIAMIHAFRSEQPKVPSQKAMYERYASQSQGAAEKGELLYAKK
jgi:carbamoyl-phosphate synthase small subunit